MDYRILIVEDELLVAYHIGAVLRDEGYPNTRIAKNLEEALAAVNDFKPHLVLSDIMLGRKPDGIKLGQYIHENLQTPFIYITSHGSIEMIREASKTRPNTYLVKPFKTPDLLAGIELALMQVSEDGEPTAAVQDENAGKVWIKDGANMLPFNISEILMLKAEENYTAVYITTDSKPVLVRHLLSGVQNMLPESVFIRVHKSFVVNKNHIVSLKYDTLSIGDITIPIGRTYKNDLQQAVEAKS